MRRTTTVLILAILILSILPVVLAEKPAPLAASVNPSFVVGDSETDDEGDDTTEEGDNANAATDDSGGGGGGGGGGLVVAPEPTDQNTSTTQGEEVVSEEQTGKRKAFLSEQVVSVTPVFRVWKVNRFVSENTEATELIESLPDNATIVFLYLPRAEQKRILNMSQEQAEETLMSYQLIAINKSLLYQTRVIPVPVLLRAQERVLETKRNYDEIKNELDEEKEKFEKAKLGRDEEQATEHAKSYLLKTVDLVIKALERIKYNVESNDDLSEEEAEQIINEIDGKIQEMEEAKSNVEAAQTKEQVKEAGRVILEAWQRTRIRIKWYATKLIHARLGEIIKRGEHLEDKLDCTLQNMEEQGINVNEIDLMVDEFSTHVNDASQKFKLARQYLYQAREMRLEDSEENKSVENLVQRAEAQIREAHQDLKDANNILKLIVREIKAQGGNITSCEEPELEEEEVYDVVEEKCEPCIIQCVLVDKVDEKGCQVCECATGEDIEKQEFCCTSTDGPCENDDDCMTGGCSGQVCQSKSEEPIVTTCEWTECYDATKYGVVCGCTDSKCQWSSE